VEINTGKDQLRSDHVRMTLQDQEILHVLHPGQIVGYQGNPSGREDRIMDLAGMYRKKRWIRSQIQGPSKVVMGLPSGCRLETIQISAESNLLYDFGFVLFYTEGMKMKSRIQSIKNSFITKEWVRMKFSGPGLLGIISVGSLVTLELDPVIPLYVQAGSLIAYPEDASLKLSVYGNTLASQHMRVQWELLGTGPVLIQTASSDPQLEQKIRQDGFLRRTLREILPFGGVYIK
jgi:uncharacterized protein (AIM24 family)